MRYLQEVARMCPNDYNYISQGAALYSEVMHCYFLVTSLMMIQLCMVLSSFSVPGVPESLSRPNEDVSPTLSDP